MVYFENLVLADGAKHQTANLLKPHISYLPAQGRPELKHVLGYFSIESKDGSPNPITARIAAVFHKNNSGLIYHEAIISDNKNSRTLKICIVMNLSDQQFEQFKSDKESGIEFLRHCVAGVFKDEHWKISMTKSVKSGSEKDKLKYTAFMLDFMEANVSAFKHNGYTVALVGDTKRSPDFYLGHGGNDAITDGQRAARLINKEVDVNKYNEDSKNRSEYISVKTFCSQPIFEALKVSAAQKFIIDEKHHATANMRLFPPAIQTSTQTLSASSTEELRG